MQRLNPLRLLLALAGMLALSLAIWQLQAAYYGLDVLRFTQDGLPVRIYLNKGADPETRPLVLVGHGFAGSSEVMEGYALTFAHAGYTVAAWDFDGHGESLRRMENADLVQNPRQVRQLMVARGLTDNQRVAIVGHSMGSGVAVEFGKKYSDVAAVVAISPVSRTVDPQLPRNLLLMAGALEPQFLLSSQLMLAQAGGAGGDLAAGTARKQVTIPAVEHVAILFSDAAHQEALRWLDGTFGPQPGRRAFHDLRPLWYVVGLLGMVLMAGALAPGAAPEAARSAGPAPLRLGAGLLGGAAAATLLLELAGGLGVDLRQLLGLSIGGYLMVWFGLAGLAAGLLSGLPLDRPTRGELQGGLVAFAALWLGFGWLGSFTWLNWTLTPARLGLWLLGTLLLLPWMLTMGEAMRSPRPVVKLSWWLAGSLLVCGSIMAAMTANPELAFLGLILPLFPVVLAVHALVTGTQGSRWVYALSGAAFVSWLLAAVFPLV
ncbi:MAG: alpha/beta hydrolase [Chloroflexota bacterium]